MLCSKSAFCCLRRLCCADFSIMCLPINFGGNAFNFENLSVVCVIVHQVFKRQVDRQIRQPRYAIALQTLGAEDSAALQDRVVSALGSASKCMAMSLVVAGAGSA